MRIEYRGYVGEYVFDPEEQEYYGEVMNIRNVVTFVGTTEEEAITAFIESIEDYLDFKAGKE